ncbi:MAG: bifunctional adenosylcobinamide kinase/adenosylcobinamide-phosphate guanylyltransferase [Actinomycetota bacterium]
MQIGTGLTLLVGGARSGKSDLAVDLGLAWAGPSGGAGTDGRGVTFVATAEAFDEDMSDRIERHRLDRPATWPTVEKPVFGADDTAQIPSDHLLILDCLTLLVSNLLFAEQPITEHVTALAAALAERDGPSIVVSNEVGMGIHPETSLGRIYRDELGRANRLVAEVSDDALLIVAGRALPLSPITGIGDVQL